MTVRRRAQSRRHTWKQQTLPVSQCAGDGAFARASDPWLTFSPNGVVYALSLSFTGAALAPSSESGILVLRSADGGMTWSAPMTLIADDSTAFNDKCSMNADPGNANYVYAVWDRLISQTSGPTYFARTHGWWSNVGSGACDLRSRSDVADDW
jgi:hypothetical protein